MLKASTDRLKAQATGSELVRAAMEKPIGSPRLSQLAQGKADCVIIVSDHTRPVPSRDILPNMISELLQGNPDIKISLLVATGFHRPTSPRELEEKLGRDIMERFPVIVHDCQDDSSNVQIGTLPSGAPLVIDALAANTELLIAEGFIEPHFFAGFSGGRKSVLPGICDKVTVLGNHCSRFIDSPYSRTGILDNNPIHQDMLAAAKMAKLAYIVNVIIDEEKNTLAAFAGDSELAHRAGCDFLTDYCTLPASHSDIVVTSNGGAPLDQNIYQCVKSMTAAEACCADDGVIIVCAFCADGHGGQGFYSALADCESPAQLYARQLATAQEETLPDQWESQILARILIKHPVIFVTRPEMRGMIESMKMHYSPDLPSAISLAKSWGKTTLSFIPNGVSVIIKG